MHCVVPRRVSHRRRASDPIFTTVDDRDQVITQLRHRVLEGVRLLRSAGYRVGIAGNQRA